METKNKKNAFITNDIEIINFDSEAVRRYEFTKKELDPAEYENFNSFEEWLPNYEGDAKTKEGKEKARRQYMETFREWADENLSYEELNEIPLMNALYYFPSCVSFSESDRQKVAGNTTLLYDTELEQWAIGMTGGGMDLSPKLLATFINLEKGIPENIALSIRANYSAGIDTKKHLENCLIVADAFKAKGKQLIARGESLKK